MSKLLTNRTDNDIKNKWNSMVRSRRAKILRQQQQAIQKSPPLFRPQLERFCLPATGQSPGPGGVYLEDNHSMAFPLKNGSGMNVVVPAVAAPRKDTHYSDSTHQASTGVPSAHSASPYPNRTGTSSYIVKQESPSRYCSGLSRPTRADVGTGKEQSYDAVSV
jgi:hypothetical protein